MRNAKQRAKQERIEELFEELAVADPKVSFSVRTEGQMIYEGGAAADELHIVGRSVDQGDVALKCVELDVQVQKGGALQCLKTPLIRIGDKAQGG